MLKRNSEFPITLNGQCLLSDFIQDIQSVRQTIEINIFKDVLTLYDYIKNVPLLRNKIIYNQVLHLKKIKPCHDLELLG